MLVAIPRKVYIVTQTDEYDNSSGGIEGVYATLALAEAAVAEAEALLVEDEMEDAYTYDIETSFLIEE